MRTWKNGIFGWSTCPAKPERRSWKAAALDWAETLTRAANATLASICPTGMRSLWKFAAFRPPASIQILAGGRALRCFQNELHHVRILNERGISSVAEVYLYWTLMGD